MSKVTITRERLEHLEDIEFKMECLERGGVYNWEWYGEALKEYFIHKEREEMISELMIEIQETLCTGVYEPSERGAGYAFREEDVADVKDLIINFMKKYKEPTND